MGKKKQRDFICPHCKENVRVGDFIILTFEVKRTHEYGLVLLSPKIGNYEVITHETIQLLDGEVLDLSCPICANSLASKKHPGLCHLLLNVGTLYFAPNKGKYATFVERNKQIVEAFGKSVSEYSRLFPGYPKNPMNKDDHKAGRVRG